MENTTSRRRSQRLFLQVRVLIEWRKPANKSPLTEETRTIVVNAHGAMVEMHAALDPGQIVTMQNIRTAEKIECVVRLATRAGAGIFNTALEFTTPNAGFWHISFPPEDWSMRDADSKRSG